MITRNKLFMKRQKGAYDSVGIIYPIYAGGRNKKPAVRRSADSVNLFGNF